MLFFSDQQTELRLQELDLRLSAADQKALRQVILGDLPELIEVVERIVPRNLESVLEENSRSFAVQRAEATWKRRNEKDKALDMSFKSQEVRGITIGGSWTVDIRAIMGYFLLTI